MPPPSGGGGGNQQSDSAHNVLWIVAGLIVGTLLLWYTGHAYITAVIFKIRLGELSVLKLFTSSLDGLYEQIEATSPATASFNYITTISIQVGKALAIPCAVFFAGLIFILYRVSSKNRYRKIYTMQSLMAQEKKQLAAN